MISFLVGGVIGFFVGLVIWVGPAAKKFHAMSRKIDESIAKAKERLGFD